MRRFSDHTALCDDNGVAGVAHHGAARQQLHILIRDDMGRAGALPDGGALEENAALHLRPLFHGDAGEEDGVDHRALNAAALGHQRVQAGPVRPDVGGGLIRPLGANRPLRDE